MSIGYIVVAMLHLICAAKSIQHVVISRCQTPQMRPIQVDLGSAANTPQLCAMQLRHICLLKKQMVGRRLLEYSIILVLFGINTSY